MLTRITNLNSTPDTANWLLAQKTVVLHKWYDTTLQAEFTSTAALLHCLKQLWLRKTGGNSDEKARSNHRDVAVNS